MISPKIAREKLGIFKTQLARAANLDVKTITKIEKGLAVRNESCSRYYIGLQKLNPDIQWIFEKIKWPAKKN
ncbi:hypothetical protein GF336_05460 [Candidatus Woesearchaeota archaeon]|nr:hypothetical protein [Candidatus Woesearchaeota archaeon]